MSQQRYERIRLVLMRQVQRDMKKMKNRKTSERLLRKHGITKTKPQNWQIVKGDLVEVIRGRDEV